MATYYDERFCPNCDEYTRHKNKDSGHERDSSGDYSECCTCKWYQIGMGGKWYPPLDNDGDLGGM